MADQVATTCRSAYFQVRQLRLITRSLIPTPRKQSSRRSSCAGWIIASRCSSAVTPLLHGLHCCEFQSESYSGCAFWSTAEFMEQPRRTSLRAFSIRTSDVDTRCRLRSADTAMLVVPFTRHSALGDHACPVASARAWNSLPSSVRNAPSLTTFRSELKTVLFRSSFDNN